MSDRYKADVDVVREVARRVSSFDWKIIEQSILERVIASVDAHCDTILDRFGYDSAEYQTALSLSEHIESGKWELE